ncbi:GNAT family N-acetyltransferase [Confluentibacter citreus]|uniref:GNAT family N-acetyltransferase n=1 Tax=Confluentibacter citreus TaxID=2007307 RepID=UPI000C2863EF|nr:GNAT family protein [Confluentibacter citreus]
MSAFDFSKDYILEDHIVSLRPLQMEDVSNLLQIANESGIWKYSFIKGDGVENLTKYIQETIQNRENKKEYPFIVIDRRTNEFAGCTRLSDINFSLQATRLGYTWYGKKFQGTGLNKHCKYLLFEFAFNQMGMERIGLAAYAENSRSINAMKSVGCVEEGKFRGIFPSEDNKKRSDAVLFSILKEEWTASKKDILKSKLISF